MLLLPGAVWVAGVCGLGGRRSCLSSSASLRGAARQEPRTDNPPKSANQPARNSYIRPLPELSVVPSAFPSAHFPRSHRHPRCVVLVLAAFPPFALPCSCRCQLVDRPLPASSYPPDCARSTTTSLPITFLQHHRKRLNSLTVSPLLHTFTTLPRPLHLSPSPADRPSRLLSFDCVPATDPWKSSSPPLPAHRSLSSLVDNSRSLWSSSSSSSCLTIHAANLSLCPVWVFMFP